LILQDLQDELNHKLQLVSDLAVQCDGLCELETAPSADKLRSHLANLQKELGELKLDAIEKQGPLKTAIKENEKRHKEMDEYEGTVRKLQQWISDTKKLTVGLPIAKPSLSPAEQQELQQVR
jgi:hypothetical protein